MGEDFAEEGEEFGLWSASCCMQGEDGDDESGDPTVNLALSGVRDNGGDAK